MRIGITNSGTLYKYENTKWVRFDFNTLYRGYYENCKFSAIAYYGDAYYIAGYDHNGNAHLFCSFEGNVWEEKGLHMTSFRYGEERAGGIVLSILYNAHMDQVVLICDSGQIVILPDCPKCVRIIRLKAAARYARECHNRIEITLENGEVQVFRFDQVSHYRASPSFLREIRDDRTVVVDLRAKEELAEGASDNSIHIPEDKVYDWLQEQDHDLKIFFVCRWGIRADWMAQYARKQGFRYAYSLGGVKELAVNALRNDQLLSS
jgi:rhodanese-related sulfurtransferase